MLASTTWIWHTSAWITAAGAGVIVLWGLFYNRSKGRRRCPQCWYALDGIPKESDGWRCPECGCLTAREERLHRIRRRWWTVIPATLALLGSYALWATPRVQREGWTGFVPTTVLVVRVHHLERPPPVLSPARFSPWQQPVPAALPKTTKHLLYEALEARLTRNDLWTWQATYLASRMRHGEEEVPPGSQAWHDRYGNLLHTALDATSPGGSAHDAFERAANRGQFLLREKYVAGFPMHVKWSGGMQPQPRGVGLAQIRSSGIVRFERAYHAFHHNYGGHYLRNDDIIELESDASDFSGWVNVQLFRETSLDPTASAKALEDHDVRLPIRVVDDIHDVIEPYDSDHIRDVLIDHLQLRTRGNHVRLFRSRSDLPDELRDALDQHPGVTLALRLEVMHSDSVLLKRTIWWRTVGQTGGRVLIEPDSYALLELTADDRERLSIAAQEGRLTLRLTGDPAVALCDVESTHYWRGQIVVPFYPKVIIFVPNPFDD